MRRLVLAGALVAVLLCLTPAVQAQSNQMIPGTQVRLTLVNGIGTGVAHDGDPFTATVAEPVFVGSQMVLPAGAKVHGTLSNVTRPKFFSMFRGGASMNMTFNSIEVESRLFPAQMSILSIYSGGTETGKQRKDVKTVEGAVLKEKRDIKGDVMAVGLGTAGGSMVGLIFSNVARGTILGLVGGGVYIVARKGKEVELPAQTGMLVRMDSALALPNVLLHTAASTNTGK
jgi:hypothetical protein